ncbi:MAG: pseudouridine synthase [Clostridia bacterium]
MMDCVRAGRYEVGVLYLDNHLLVVRKPVNMPVQEDASGDLDLLTAMKAYIGEKFQKPGSVYLGLVHRLDRPVGGVMVLARTSKAAARLCAAFAEHAVAKRYLAILEGVLGEQVTLTDYLLKGTDGMVRVVGEQTQGAKRASLTSRPLAVNAGRTLAQIELMTGRSHQIRVQHAARHLPLWGDQRYGHGVPGEQLALWAYSLAFAHPTTKQEMAFIDLPSGGAWQAFAGEIEALDGHA